MSLLKGAWTHHEGSTNGSSSNINPITLIVLLLNLIFLCVSGDPFASVNRVLFCWLHIGGPKCAQTPREIEAPL